MSEPEAAESRAGPGAVYVFGCGRRRPSCLRRRFGNNTGEAMTTSRRIFLAHAREDKAQVRRLYADLKARSLDPWLDEVDLLPGQIWKTQIPKVIHEAGIFLAWLSSRSVEKVGYVQNEFRLALSAFGEPPRIDLLGSRSAR
jgi:TIR domain